MSVVEGKVVLGTGFTGSLGRQMTKRLLADGVKKVIVFSRDEYKQRHMMAEYNDPRIQFEVGDVRDGKRLSEIVKGVDYVIHAAALKHVPTGEEQPMETIKTNIIGTYNLIYACKKARVEKCVLVATDKGSHPVNMYGGTKFVAEKLFISSNLRSDTIFCAVRYGNVIGSRGSVIETILTKHPKTLNITDQRMTRFWMTLDDACDIIYKALEEAAAGEVYIPKVKSMLVSDMFGALAPDIKLVVSGIRAGEKLHECLINEDESYHTQEHSDHYIIKPELFGCDYRDLPFTFTSANAEKLSKTEFLKMVSKYFEL